MIILGLLNIVTFILSFLFRAIGSLIPELGPEVELAINNFMGVLDTGVDMFCFLLGPVASILVTYIIAFQILKSTWDLIWFIIRKIPMLNIRQ